MPENPHIPPVWFDTEQGLLLAGSEQDLRPLTENPNVRRLGELLCAEDFPYKSGDFEQIIPTDGWEQEECKVYGHWLLQVLEPHTAEAAPDERLTREHLKRARVLGIGPAYGRIERRFKKMANFREALDIHSGRAPGKYDAWSRQNFATYAADVASRLDRRPTNDDYREAREQWGGPSTWIIQNRFGGAAGLNELIGYPNVQEWDRDDCISWGADVMRANDGAGPSFDLIQVICERQAGPSYWFISRRFKRFGGFKTFQHLAAQKRQEQLEDHEEHYDSQLRWAKENLDEESLAIIEELSEPDRLAFIGRYQTAKKCLKNRDPEVYRNLAKATPGSFIRLTRNKQPGLTAGEIETTAEMIGVMGDIWPPEEYLKRLRVTPDSTEQKPQPYKEIAQNEPSQKAA